MAVRRCGAHRYRSAPQLPRSARGHAGDCRRAPWNLRHYLWRSRLAELVCRSNRWIQDGGSSLWTAAPGICSAKVRATPCSTWRLTPANRRLDVAAGILRLGPASMASPAGVIAADLHCIISTAEHASNVTLEGLRLEGSAAEGRCGGLPDRHPGGRARSPRHCGYRRGVRLDRATGTRITGSEIARTGGHGIYIRHGSNGTVASGNWIHDVGWLHQDASAIWFDASSHNVFSHNLIEDVAKFGIGGGSLTDGGAYDNRIEYNGIRRTNQRTSDGGAIMVIGWAQDATHDMIRGNFISGTSALGNVGWDDKPHTTFQDPVTRLVSQAVYLDDWASGVEVRGNLLCGNIGGVELHSGWDNQVDGNILIGNAGIAFDVDAVNWLGSGAHPHAMEHNRIEHNLAVINDASTGQSGVTALRGGAEVANFDHNTYAGPGLNDRSFHHEPVSFWSGYSGGIAAWRRFGQDAASDVGSAAVQVKLRGGVVRVTGTDQGPSPLPLIQIGRPEDRAGIAERVREACGLSKSSSGTSGCGRNGAPHIRPLALAQPGSAQCRHLRRRDRAGRSADLDRHAGAVARTEFAMISASGH